MGNPESSDKSRNVIHCIFSTDCKVVSGKFVPRAKKNQHHACPVYQHEYSLRVHPAEFVDNWMQMTRCSHNYDDSHCSEMELVIV